MADKNSIDMIDAEIADLEAKLQFIAQQMVAIKGALQFAGDLKAKLEKAAASPMQPSDGDGDKKPDAAEG